MRRLRLIALIFGAIFALSPFANAQVPPLDPIPESLSGPEREELEKRGSKLEDHLTALHLKVTSHNQKCGKVPAKTPLAEECRQAQAALKAEITAYAEQVKSFNQMLADAVRRQRSIDRIEVPPPSRAISPVEVCAGEIACIMGMRIGEGMDWLQQKLWDMKVWANDPMHGQWLMDAFTIGTLPFAARGILAAISRGVAGAGEAAAGRAALGPKHLYVTAEQFGSSEFDEIYSNAFKKAGETIFHIAHPNGSVTTLNAKVIEGGPKHVWLTLDQFTKINPNSRNVLYFIEYPDGTIKTLPWFIGP